MSGEVKSFLLGSQWFKTDLLDMKIDLLEKIIRNLNRKQQNIKLLRNATKRAYNEGHVVRGHGKLS